MDDLIGQRFTLVDGIAVARLRGTVSAQDAIAWIGQTLAFARQCRHTRLLMSTRAAGGFQPPSLARRVEMIREWAAVAGNKVAVALVCPAEFIDPQKFGVTVAAGFGLTADVFAHEREALEWLRSLA